LISLKYKKIGVCQRYLLEYFGISSSTFYSTIRMSFSNGWIKKKDKKRCKGYSMKTTGETISDEEIEKIFVSIYENENCNEPEYYIKALGDKKLSKVLKKRYGIIVNHKKIYRMRKELGLLRKYKKHTKHARKRPKNHEVSDRNKYWEADIKFIPTEKDGYVPMIDVIDVRDRTIVGTHLGQKSKSKNFIECIDRAIKYREADTKGLTIRTDNGPQFKSKATEAYMEEMGIEHEFGYKNNPNSQAYIESHHSVIEREFVELNEFEYIEDVYNAYKAYIYFYQEIRPHGSLGYKTPNEYDEASSERESKKGLINRVVVVKK